LPDLGLNAARSKSYSQSAFAMREGGAMDLFSRIVQREDNPTAPTRKTLRKNSIDHWPLVVLLERAAYLRKLAALGDGTASETLKEYPQHSTMLCVRSRSGDVELHDNFACMFHVLDGRATLLTGSIVAGAEPIASGDILAASIEPGSRQELRAGDVVHIPTGQRHQILVAGEKTVTYLAVKIQETP
jgi:mannose-6-phosphate isomerase-like protein (cupin superfamily)